MNYTRHRTLDPYLDKVRVHTEPYTAEILGKKILIFPNVMSPKYDRSSQMIIKMMPTQNGRTVLEVGCGTGILSLFTLFQGAKNVVAVDINPEAVENTKQNFQYYALKNAHVTHGDLFENVEGAFDTVLFNAPFHGNKPEDILEFGTSDFEYQTLRRFFQQVGKFLKPRGYILLGFADTGDNELLGKLIHGNQFKIDTLQAYENGDWTMYLYMIRKLSEFV